MAYPIRVKKRFEVRLIKVYTYLSENWNQEIANDFLGKVERKMDAVATNPDVGSPSVVYKNLRSLSVTVHNRLFYRVENNIVIFVMLSDTRKR